MGNCHTTCFNTSSLEFYDAWRHPSIRRPFNTKTYQNKGETKLWMCKRGCCSVRWKLDYAEFQSYFKYVEVSPYVVLQDKTRQCKCVMCCGVSNAVRRWDGPSVLKQNRNMETYEGRISTNILM
ncbi:uncharacterized protein PHALS_08541 [Plasmopara halstedii]|uniref:Uncharacterized protein n=1 Tax=Plasmopara halstedii TaxID=4781 RepID=A0A0P1ACR1_PLAHL|nr:uncharacterized protein PHALS_08541 [Plasmopara halstedii]CEG38469.1 hypothetical protein PHALS_08541 [Plasmopara halstedii]|eukprot:XP_024574838.1 hypothetical protein PHALS_08541 [Plasmopara halstedii]